MAYFPLLYGARRKSARLTRCIAVLLSLSFLSPIATLACPVATPDAANTVSNYTFETPASPSRAVQTGLLTVRENDTGALRQIRIGRAARTFIGSGTVVRGASPTNGAGDLPLLPRDAPKAQLLRQAPLRRPALSTMTLRGERTNPETAHLTPNVVNPATPAPTGLKPWWTFMSGKLVGVGSYNFNVKTGNLLVRSTDLTLRNKTLPISFTRAYNVMSTHDYENTDGSTPSNYGEGWTNSFDAHIATNTGGGLSIYDGTGARYDYTSDGSGGWTPPAGVHAQLTLDQCSCDYLWWMPNGTVLHFKNPAQSPNNAALAGRLDSIYGRNRNAYVTFTYSFTNGDASSSANLSQIVAQTDDGRKVTLVFADFAKSGGGTYRLLSTLKWPDNTTVTYHYDGYANLTQVDEPGNNAGTSLSQAYTYASPSSVPHLINLILSPRYFESSNTDGGYRLFDFDVSSRKLTSWCYHGWANPSINDGFSSGPLQPAPAPTGIIDYRDFTVTYNASNTTVTDTTGHKVVFTYDSSNDRISQVAGYLGSGSSLTINKTYDADNNLVSVKDPRGNQSDMQYDANGNLVAAAAPSATSSGSNIRSTTLISYDSNNNPTAVCDPVWSHSNGHDWTATPAPSDTLCPAGSGNARITYTKPSYEPYGEVSQVTSPGTTAAPSGYTRTLSYPSTGDQGMPIAVTGASFTQSDSTNWTPETQFTYNSAGDPICYNAGKGWYVMQYDAMGRLTAVGDPDDNSIAGCGKSGAPYTTASYIQYYPNGQIKLTETPYQHSSGTGMTYAYDPDGNLTSVTHHFVGAGNTTKYWHDAGDRIVEVQLPKGSSNEYYAFNWMRRYYYDLTGGTVTIGSTSGLKAYGNLFESQEYLQGATQAGRTPTGTKAWTSVSGQTYDALDRPIATYDLAASSSPQRTRTYDATGKAGLLSSVTDGLNETTTLTYDPLRVTGVSFSGDGGVTPARTYTYDADNRPLSIASTGIGTQSYTYDNTGNVTQSVEPSGSGITSPGTLTYAYYPNGAREALSLSSSGYSQTNLQQYSYRADGLPQTLNAALLAGHGPYKWTYTNAGRMLTQTDPYTGLVISNVNSPYSGSYTLSPTTKTYDTYGRVASETLPMTGQYTNYTYDPEGEVTGYTGFYAPGDITGNYGKRQASYTYSARGELVGVHHTDVGNSQFNPAWPHYNMNAANGFLYPQVEPSASPPPTFTFDALDDMALQKNQTSNGSQKAYTRDAIGRQNKATLSGGSLSGNYTRSYDAEDHLIKHVFTTYTTPSLRPDCVGNDADDAKYTGTHTYSWGPNGHPIKMDNETLHWDGDTLLYTSNSSGVVDDVKTGLLADSSPGLSANVAYDRDDSGVVVSNHNSTGFAGWTPPDAYGQRCASGPPASSTSYQNAYVNKTFGPVNGPASDGIFDGYNVVQGGHSFDNKTGQWATMDTQGQATGDPMSGKPLMSVRNNSLRFTDKTGMSPVIYGSPLAFQPVNFATFSIYNAGFYEGNAWIVQSNLPPNTFTHAFFQLDNGGGPNGMVYAPITFSMGPAFFYTLLEPENYGDTLQNPGNLASAFQLLPPEGVSEQAWLVYANDIASEVQQMLSGALYAACNSNCYGATVLAGLGFSDSQIRAILGGYAFGGNVADLAPTTPATQIILGNGLSLLTTSNSMEMDQLTIQQDAYSGIDWIL